MNENETPPVEGENSTPTTNPTPEVTSEPTPATTPEATDVGATEVSAAVASSTAKKNPIKVYAIAIGAVVIILLGVLYLLEKDGRSSTTIFSSVIAGQEAGIVVAVVNGEKITNSELGVSIQQFSQAAAAQGVDLTNPDSQVEIRNQALDVLVNTKLLKQAAIKRGITVTDEQTDERLGTIISDIGGEEVLAERLEILGIDPEQLHRDVKDELIIKGLLDTVFLGAEIVVTDEEVAALYEDAGGVDAGLPALEEVREQIEAQIVASKEQATIDDYLTELKSVADIEVN
ncbi:MAG: hypothetical protein ACI9BF_000540 [Candidatus Paceibacteria bacterium]|jgi:hypothetical protein